MISVAAASVDERAKFIKQTYTHLAGAIVAFIIVEFIFFQIGLARMIAEFVFSTRLAWFAILGGMSLLGWFSRELLSQNDDRETQYKAFGLYIIGKAIIFAPILYIAANYTGDPNLIPTAATLTVFLFAGLTTIAFTSRQDFSFLNSILKVGGFVALGLIICSLIFGFSLGMWFSAFMIIFASAAILRDTSKVIHKYQTHQYVAAAFSLFASVMLLFYYVVRILIRTQSRR
ncbi:MAG: Bax inhibitor-1 family protein [Cyanobacteria bacterium P01_F01_bin.143]